MPINDYCTIADVKAAFPDQGATWGALYDTFLTTTVTGASRAIDLYCNRQFSAFCMTDSVANLYSGADAADLLFGSTPYPALVIDDMAAAPTKVELSPTGDPNAFVTLAATDYFMYPTNALRLTRPYYAIVLDVKNGQYRSWYPYPNNVRITGLFGWSTTTPDMVKRAAVIEASRTFQRGRMNWQDLVVRTDGAQEVYQATTDPDVQKLVRYLVKARL